MLPFIDTQDIRNQWVPGREVPESINVENVRSEKLQKLPVAKPKPCFQYNPSSQIHAESKAENS